MAQVVATALKQEDAAPLVLDEVVSQEFEDSAVRALHIEEILEKFMAYLPVSDLKSARLVCQKWNDVGAEALEARAVLQLPNKERELPSRLFTSVTIKDLDNSFGQEFLTTLCNLFQKEGKNVKYLSIDNNQPLESVDIYRGIFDATTEVETLCLKSFCVNYHKSLDDAKTLFEGKFPNLKTLQIRPQYIKNSYIFYNGAYVRELLDDPVVLAYWVKHLFWTNITTLQLPSTFCGILKICNELLLADATKCELLPKLECAIVRGCKDSLNFFLHLSHPLKRIRFEDLYVSNYFESGNESHSFLTEQVLKEYSESLEVVHIFFRFNKCCLPGNPVFSWPLLPKLKHLSVGGTRHGYSFGEGFDLFCIQDLFKNSAELKAKLPNLEQLTLNFQYDGFLEMFSELLFHFPSGSEDKKFPQIKRLEVYHSIASMMDEEWPQIQSGWGKIFPNAKITLLTSKKAIEFMKFLSGGYDTVQAI